MLAFRVVIFRHSVRVNNFNTRNAEVVSIGGFSSVMSEMFLHLSDEPLYGHLKN